MNSIKNLSISSENCVIDPTVNLCRHCFRTADEISSWDNLSKTDKIFILRAAEKRRDALKYFPADAIPDLSCLI